MDRVETMKSIYPEAEVMTPGHLACQGCGASMAMRLVLKALGNRTIMVLPACCGSIIAGPFPYIAMNIPLIHMAFEATAAAASGIRAALEVLGKEDVQVLGWAGDGATFDIGIQSLSGAADRNDDIFYVCLDNEAYMNTGIQRSSATPTGAWTATTPAKHLNERPKKNMVEIMAAHKVPYVATCTIAYPNDLMDKVQRAAAIRGTKFLHLLAPCPTGWRYDPRYTVKVSRLAVETGFFPLYEVFNGEEYNITVPSKGLPVEKYLSTQGRFRYMSAEDIKATQDRVEFEWEELQHRAARKAPHA